MEFLQNKYFLIALTFGFYLGAQLLQRRFRAEWVS